MARGLESFPTRYRFHRQLGRCKLTVALKSFFLAVCANWFAVAQPGIISAAADPWPPFADPEHPRQGVALEIIRAAYGTQGYSVVMHFVPWSRAESGVNSGQYDILIDVWFTQARAKQLLFSKPYASNELRFIKRREDPFEYGGLGSLNGKIVGTIRGYGYSSDFLTSKGFKREETADLMQNIRKLLANRIDLTLEDEIVAKAMINREDPLLFHQIAFTKTAFATNPLHLAAGLNNPRCTALVEAFNAGLHIIKSNKTYEKILASYGMKSTDPR
jgi:polar amino acid transport system substrate-binding protein